MQLDLVSYKFQMSANKKETRLGGHKLDVENSFLSLHNLNKFHKDLK